MEKISLSLIFTTKNIRNYIKNISLSLIIVSLFEIWILHLIYDNRVAHLKNETTALLKESNYDFKLVCNVTKCKYIIYDDIVYIVKDTIKLDRVYDYNLKDRKIPGLCFTKDFYSILYLGKVDKHKIVLIVDDKRYLKNIIRAIYYNILMLIFIFTVTYFSYIYYLEKSNLVEKRTYELELEGTLQRTLTESAHHEMMMPLAVIKTLFNDFIRQLYPCDINDNGICSYITDKSPCSECKHKNSNYTRRVDNLVIDYFNKINLAIEQLESVLSQMSETKHIKYSNGNKGIYELLNNAVQTINSSSVQKLSLNMRDVDEELLNKYSVSKPLTNGGVLNIFSNHIKNSKEAKATIIKVKAMLSNDNKLIIYLGDNGIGIRDKYGKIIDTEMVFKNGFSTKDKAGNRIVVENTIWNRIDDFIATHILFKLADSKSVRGVGLFINKNILNKAGGDVELVDTSSEGTVFKITIPIKKKHTE